MGDIQSYLYLKNGNMSNGELLVLLVFIFLYYLFTYFLNGGAACSPNAYKNFKIAPWY